MPGLVLMVRNSRRIELPKSKTRRFLKRDREGVASTVGTIMALLVFLTFLGVFTNTYIPLWMQDNERSHMNEVMNEFGQLKGQVDSLIAVHQATGSSRISMYSPITLGAQGVPVFASPTLGQLTYSPSGTANTTGMRITFNYTAGTQTVEVDNTGGGKLELYSPNRYYVQQWVAYENGAILVKQLEGQAMRAFPSIEVSAMSNGYVDLSFTEVDLIGVNSSLAGTGSVGVNIDLEYLDSQFISMDGTNVVIRFNTQYNSTWYDFFSEMCEEAGLVEGLNYTLRDNQISDSTHEIVFVITECGALTYNRAYITATLQL